MQDQEFRKLLDKSLNGSLTDNEKKLLDRFTRELELHNKKLPFESDLHKNEIKKALWMNIQNKTSKAKPIKLKKWRASAVAAIFIGLLTTSYFYFNNNSTAISTNIPDNAITLEMEDGTIKVIDEAGRVEILDAEGKVVGQQDGASLKYADTQTKKELVYNTLTVPYAKTFELQLSDGTTAHLNAGSSIKYPIQFLKGQSRQVFITGEAYLNVAKDSLHPFIASSDGLNVQVLGTQFNFSAYPEDETTDVVLVEGSVSLFTETNGYNAQKNTLLKPGVKGTFNRQGDNVTTEKVSTDQYTSWMDGKLIFRNMTFGNILKKLERHYNVSIINKNKELDNKEFNANFGNQTIVSVLEELKINYGIDYSISDSRIIIK